MRALEVIFALPLIVANVWANPPQTSKFITFALPDGWHVEVDKEDYTATSTAAATNRTVSVQVCARSQEDCGKTCNSSELRPNYFYFFRDAAKAEYSQPRRVDEFFELRGVGTVTGVSGWIAGSVLCGPQGIVYIGAISMKSKTDALNIMLGVVASVRISTGSGGQTK